MDFPTLDDIAGELRDFARSHPLTPKELIRAAIAARRRPEAERQFIYRQEVYNAAYSVIRADHDIHVISVYQPGFKEALQPAQDIAFEIARTLVGEAPEKVICTGNESLLGAKKWDFIYLPDHG